MVFNIKQKMTMQYNCTLYTCNFLNQYSNFYYVWLKLCNLLIRGYIKLECKCSDIVKSDFQFNFKIEKQNLYH